jgi:hypothetical protein
MDSLAIKRRRVRRKVPYRDFYRAILAGLLLIFVFAAGFYDRQWFGFGGSKDMPYTLNDPSDHALRTGSILFVPPSGNRCKHRVIDNYTWFMRDNGFVNCDELVHRGSEPITRDYNSSPRLDAIRDAFSRKR